MTRKGLVVSILIVMDVLLEDSIHPCRTERRFNPYCNGCTSRSGKRRLPQKYDVSILIVMDVLLEDYSTTCTKNTK